MPSHFTAPSNEPCALAFLNGKERTSLRTLLEQLTGTYDEYDRAQRNAQMAELETASRKLDTDIETGDMKKVYAEAGARSKDWLKKRWDTGALNCDYVENMIVLQSEVKKLLEEAEAKYGKDSKDSLRTRLVKLIVARMPSQTITNLNNLHASMQELADLPLDALHQQETARFTKLTGDIERWGVLHTAVGGHHRTDALEAEQTQLKKQIDEQLDQSRVAFKEPMEALRNISARLMDFDIGRTFGARR